MIQAGQLQGSLGGTAPYFFGSTPVYPATAISSPTNASLGVPAGMQGGAGMAMPAGATKSPAGGTGGMGMAADIIGILGNTASNYIQAGVVPTVTPELPPPTNGALMIPMLNPRQLQPTA